MSCWGSVFSEAATTTIVEERGGERVVVTAGLSWGRIVDKREREERLKLKMKNRRERGERKLN